MKIELSDVIRKDIAAGTGGEDLDLEDVIEIVARACY